VLDLLSIVKKAIKQKTSELLHFKVNQRNRRKAQSKHPEAVRNFSSRFSRLLLTMKYMLSGEVRKQAVMYTHLGS
jgi:hypothetical protein